MGSFAAVDDPALITLMTTGLVSKAPGSASGSLDLDFTADFTVFDYLEDTEVVTLAYTLVIADRTIKGVYHTTYKKLVSEL